VSPLKLYPELSDEHFMNLTIMKEFVPRNHPAGLKQLVISRINKIVSDPDPNCGMEVDEIVCLHGSQLSQVLEIHFGHQPVNGLIDCLGLLEFLAVVGFAEFE
jgi:hypothetical protein